MQLKHHGQSLWMNNLSRSLIESGELKEMIETRGLRGITSNPAIFEKAIASSQIYDADIEAGIRAGKSVHEIYESLVIEDVRNACDIFQPVYDSSGGLDGYVSIEISPHLAHDTKGIIAEARRFYERVDRENVMMRIPGTSEGFMAVEQAIGRGININIALLSAVDSYVRAAQAYVRGLENRAGVGEPIDRIASVASFFLSRMDNKVDDRVDERLKQKGTECLNEKTRLKTAKGKVAITNAKAAYQKFEEIVKSDRWQRLAGQGANRQRLLWASTSTQNPLYSDVMYVEELVGINGRTKRVRTV